MFWISSFVLTLAFFQRLRNLSLEIKQEGNLGGVKNSSAMVCFFFHSISSPHVFLRAMTLLLLVCSLLHNLKGKTKSGIFCQSGNLLSLEIHPINTCFCHIMITCQAPIGSLFFSTMRSLLLVCFLFFYSAFAQSCSANDFVVTNGATEYLRVNNSGLYACGNTAVCSQLNNALQSLSLSGSTLSITSANSVTLPDASSTNEIQALSLSGATVSLSLNGGSITLPDSSPTNEIQSLTVSGASLTISGGNSVTLPDASVSNEIQTISRSGATVSLSLSGGSITLPDADSTNEIQSLSLIGDALSISSSNSVTLPDVSASNEIQSIGFSPASPGSAAMLSISSGNSISLNGGTWVSLASQLVSTGWADLTSVDGRFPSLAYCAYLFFFALTHAVIYLFYLGIDVGGFVHIRGAVRCASSPAEGGGFNSLFSLPAGTFPNKLESYVTACGISGVNGLEGKICIIQRDELGRLSVLWTPWGRTAAVGDTIQLSPLAPWGT